MGLLNLEKRYYGNGANGYNCQNGYDEYGGCYSAWDSWARWVVLAIIVIGAIFLFFLFSCISSRRRRRMGYSPYRGTGWALGRTPPGHAPATYNGQQYGAQAYHARPQQETNAPPAYGAGNDYYGRQNDVELQQPQASYYRGGDDVYGPPSGPPPAKTRDGIIR